MSCRCVPLFDLFADRFSLPICCTVFSHACSTAAVAARYAQERHGLGKVMIFDFDAHHGNGTQAIFYDDPTVLYVSHHQQGIFPG